MANSLASHWLIKKSNGKSENHQDETEDRLKSDDQTLVIKE